VPIMVEALMGAFRNTDNWLIAILLGILRVG